MTAMDEPSDRAASAPLGPDTLLQRADALDASIGIHGGITITVDGRSVDAGSRGLALLDAFAVPRTIKQAIEILGVAGAQDWVQITGVIRRLVKGGVLVRSGERGPKPGALGFGSARVHVGMLNDRSRTRAYLDAIAQTVNDGDVVVDIGTGTGVLAVAAARAGAQKVYAIEMNPRIADVALGVFEANGVADRVELINGQSTEVELPERCDVLVSETIGNRILDEQMLQIFKDAKLRLLKPDARRIPSELAAVAIPTQVPDEHVARAVASPEAVAEWFDWYGTDLAALQTLAPNDRRPFVSLPPRRMRDWDRLAEPVDVVRARTDDPSLSRVDAHLEFEIQRPGTLNGLSLAFEATLAPDITLTNSPAGAADDCHWLVPTWPIVPPRSVTAGDAVRLQIQSEAAGFRVTRFDD